MKDNVVKRIVQIFLALAGVAGILYVSPLLAVPLTMQLGWSARRWFWLWQPLWSAG